MFMYQDNLYYFEKTYKNEPPYELAYDVKVDSTVDLTEIPSKNGQSNFGIYEYVLMDDGSIEFYIGDSEWMVLSARIDE